VKQRTRWTRNKKQRVEVGRVLLLLLLLQLEVRRRRTTVEDLKISLLTRTLWMRSQTW
jgi:hypothetical protein